MDVRGLAAGSCRHGRSAELCHRHHHQQPSPLRATGCAQRIRVVALLGRCGNPVGGRYDAMSTLTTNRIGNELVRDTLMTIDQLTTGLSVLGMTAAMQPEQCPRVRTLLADLLAQLQDCENDLGLYEP